MPPVSTVTANGPAIRASRERRGLSLQQLADKIGRHPQALRHVELGTRRPSMVLLNQIANALGVEPTDLVRHDANGSAA